MAHQLIALPAPNSVTATLVKWTAGIRIDDELTDTEAFLRSIRMRTDMGTITISMAATAGGVPAAAGPDLSALLESGGTIRIAAAGRRLDLTSISLMDQNEPYRFNLSGAILEVMRELADAFRDDMSLTSTLTLWDGEGVDPFFVSAPSRLAPTAPIAGPSLLPPNASRLEVALDGTVARVGAIPLKISDLWNPELCPDPLLAWLAWALSVDYWRADWPEDVKRRVIGESIPIHFEKGSVASVRRALKAAGYADAEIGERVGNTDPGHDWAEFDVNLDIGEDQAVTAESLRQARLLVESVVPVSRHLAAFLGFRSTIEEAVGVSEVLEFAVGVTLDDQVRVNAGIHYDGSVRYDGSVGYEAERDQLNVMIRDTS